MDEGHIANAHLTTYLTSIGRRLSAVVCNLIKSPFMRNKT